MNKVKSETSKRSTVTTGSVAVDADNKEIILDTSDKAATYCTGLTGWVSRDGYYFGDNKDSENMAKYKGSTHRSCKYLTLIHI